jgi:hypothetical protein
MPGKQKYPSYMRRCVADVVSQGKDTSAAFAICNATMQKAGYLTPGPGQEQTAKGRKRARHFAAMKDQAAKDAEYEAALGEGADRYDLDFAPPASVRRAAKLGLEVRQTKPESQRGGTEIGIARARDLMNGVNLSPRTVRRMKAYFDRHAIDKNGATWSERGKGWQAWHLWGGDPGRDWAEDLVRRMNEADAKVEHVRSGPLSVLAENLLRLL